jgi:hypothetical protein
VHGDKRPQFQAWLRAVGAKVFVRTTESFSTNPPRDWYLFEVREPVNWDAVSFGFPTIAPASVQSSADTTTNTPSPSFDWSTFFPIGAAGAAPLLLFLGALWAIGSSGNRRR